jgi:hypothetical protein
MRTRTLLLAGLISVASAAVSMAQTVYSVNAVGFVNVVCPPGFSLICNPLNASTNTVSALFPSPPNNTSIYKFDPPSGLFVGNTYLFGSWGTPNMTVVPGEGFFFKNPGTSDFTNTFVGNVQQGTLTTPLSVGFQIVSSQVPQQGLVATDLGMPVEQNTSVYVFNNALNRYDGSTFLFGSWGSGEPQVGVGQAFFLKRVTSGNWTRTFNANQ